MNRTELAIAHLSEEWETVVVLCSKFDGSDTTAVRFMDGNGFAVQQMLEDQLDDMLFADGGEDGEEEESRKD